MTAWGWIRYLPCSSKFGGPADQGSHCPRLRPSIALGLLIHSHLFPFSCSENSIGGSLGANCRRRLRREAVVAPFHPLTHPRAETLSWLLFQTKQCNAVIHASNPKALHLLGMNLESKSYWDLYGHIPPCTTALPDWKMLSGTLRTCYTAS